MSDAAPAPSVAPAPAGETRPGETDTGETRAVEARAGEARAGETHAGETHARGDPAPGLSKNQQRKQRRKEKALEQRAAKRAAEKRKRAEGREARREEVARRLEEIGDDAEAREALMAEIGARKRQALTARREARDAARARVRRAVEGGEGISVCVDMAWSDLMGPKEHKSLKQQVGYCYNAVLSAPAPIHLHLTGLAPGDAMAREVEGISGIDNWICSRSEKDLGDVFAGRMGDLVYLSADAEDTLEVRGSFLPRARGSLARWRRSLGAAPA